MIPRSLAIVLVAAALFRAVYFYYYSKTSIFFDGLILDSQIYDGWAKSIASGEWLGKEAFYFPPLYPYLLGALYRLFGPSHALIYGLQALLGVVNLLLIARIATLVFGRRAGLLAAAGAALYGPFAFFETKILLTTLGLTLNLLALLVLVGAERAARETGRIPLPSLFRAGLTIGAAAVCLPASILLALLCAGARALRDLKEAAILLAGTVVVLLPILAHNLYVAGDPLFLSGQGGITFYQGNNPTAQGLYNVLPGFSGAPELQASEEKAIAEREAGRPLRRSEVSSHFFGKGLSFILGAPASYLALELKKLGALLGEYEASTEYSIYLEREQIPWLRIAFLPFAAIAGLGVAGLLGPSGHAALRGVLALAGLGRWTMPGVRRRDADREGAAGAGFLLLYTLYAAAIPMLFYVSSRYRLPLVPALLIFGAAFVDRVMVSLRRKGDLASAEARGLLVATLGGLVSFFPLGAPSVTAEANVYYNIGNILAEKGLHEEAIRHFDRCLADFPRNAFALINRGNSLDKLGRPDEALESYHRAEEVRPDFWKAYQAQGNVLRHLGRLQEEAETYRRGIAAGGAQAHFMLATSLQAAGRLDEAAGEIREAIRLKPNEAHFHTTLGEILEGQRLPHAAVPAYQDAVRLDPRNTKALLDLGILYRELGQINDAAPILEELLGLDPRNAIGHARLGDIYALSGQKEKARAEYTIALSLDPGQSFAKAGLDRLGR